MNFRLMLILRVTMILTKNQNQFPTKIFKIITFQKNKASNMTKLLNKAENIMTIQILQEWMTIKLICRLVMNLKFAMKVKNLNNNHPVSLITSRKRLSVNQWSKTLRMIQVFMLTTMVMTTLTVMFNQMEDSLI